MFPIFFSFLFFIKLLLLLVLYHSVDLWYSNKYIKKRFFFYLEIDDVDSFFFSTGKTKKIPNVV